MKNIIKNICREILGVKSRNYAWRMLMLVLVVLGLVGAEICKLKDLASLNLALVIVVVVILFIYSVVDILSIFRHVGCWVYGILSATLATQTSTLLWLLVSVGVHLLIGIVLLCYIKVDKEQERIRRARVEHTTMHPVVEDMKEFRDYLLKTNVSYLNKDIVVHNELIEHKCSMLQHTDEVIEFLTKVDKNKLRYKKADVYLANISVIAREIQESRVFEKLNIRQVKKYGTCFMNEAYNVVLLKEVEAISFSYAGENTKN